MTLRHALFCSSFAPRFTVAVGSVALAASILACSSSSTVPSGGNAGAAAVGGAPNAAGASGALSGAAGALAATGGAPESAGAQGVAGAAAGAGASSAGAGGDNQAGASGALGAGGAVSISHAADAAFCSAAFDSAAADYKGFLAANTDPTKVPRSASGSVVTKVDITDWTSGFIAGNLWLLYEHSKDEAYKTAAAAWTAALYSARLRTDTHDVGFIIMSSYGNGYRITQNADYATVIKQAGVSLATRFSAKVGATRSWDDPAYSYPVIIDNMMNLELLYRATTLGGSATLAADAVQHALTTKTNHFRPDFSSYHLVDYDPSTGAVIKKETVQGISDDSAWARGQTWGLYGFTMGYRESKDQRFLDQALAIAEFYTKHADFPSDNVPFFDFSTVQRTDVPDYRDSSAGAVAAGGLLELANYATPEAAERYRAFAIKALRSLASPSYRAPAGSNGNFLLLHSVGNYPANTEIDVALNYADYYYLEALGRCAALK